MTAAADLLARLQAARATTDSARVPANLDLAINEIDLLIDALQRPEVRQSCASTSNYPVMAERALRLISRNRVSDREAIEGITHLVDCAGLDYAQQDLEDGDDVPF